MGVPLDLFTAIGGTELSPSGLVTDPYPIGQRGSFHDLILQIRKYRAELFDLVFDLFGSFFIDVNPFRRVGWIDHLTCEVGLAPHDLVPEGEMRSLC